MHVTVEYERIRRAINSSYNKWTYVDETAGYNPNALRELKCGIDRSVAGEGEIVPFYHPFVPNSFSGTGSSYIYYKGIDSSLILNGKTYHNVANFELIPDDIWYPNTHPIETRYPKAKFYWAKNVGLIKRHNLTENYSWELIEYHLIQ
jgi:hypothetical protein